MVLKVKSEPLFGRILLLMQTKGLKPLVILIGDSIGDVHMAEGLNTDIVLKIGFLNLKIEERLEEFKLLLILF